jgi:hypothetical protein
MMGAAPSGVFSPLVTMMLGAAYYVAPAFALRKFRPSVRTWACYLVQPFYLVLSGPLAIVGFLRMGHRRWSHTLHAPHAPLAVPLPLDSEPEARVSVNVPAA